MEANIPLINKHFIQWLFHWLMSKIFHLLLSTWIILDFLKWVTRSICFLYRPTLPTNKALHLGFPENEEGFALPRVLSWYKSTGDLAPELLFAHKFHLCFHKTKDNTLSMLHCKVTIWKARFYFTQFFFSHKVEENCQLSLILSWPLKYRCLEMPKQKGNNSTTTNKT